LSCFPTYPFWASNRLCQNLGLPCRVRSQLYILVTWKAVASSNSSQVHSHFQSGDWSHLLPSLPLFSLLDFSHPFLSFKAPPGAIYPTLDFHPTLAFKVWWVSPPSGLLSHCLSYCGPLPKPQPGERLPPSNWVDSPAIFWGCLGNPGACTYHSLSVGSEDAPTFWYIGPIREDHCEDYSPPLGSRP
jgi:hypothetical protein